MQAQQLPRKPFPILNAGRYDLLPTVILFIFLSASVLIVRSSQPEQPGNRHVWKHVFVIFGSILALVLGCLAIIKTFCGYDSDEDGYAILPDEEAPRQEERKVAPQASAVPPRAPAAAPGSEAESKGQPVSARSAGLSPRFWDDIDCGIEVEAADTDFEYNGVNHNRGAIRITRLEPDGVCEVTHFVGTGSYAHLLDIIMQLRGELPLQD
mmetsp:Transcript_44947/g.70468  ORF Transcript_44947/g.70468 Transcript_44947/m.70468 type:complete len:210 (+) Transcript_44947:29-658(+)